MGIETFEDLKKDIKGENVLKNINSKRLNFSFA
jgi:hypothetical protein